MCIFMNIQLNEYFHVQCIIYTHIYTMPWRL